MFKSALSLSFASAIIAMTVSGAALAGKTVLDLTHPIPTFKASQDDSTKADLSQPWLDSQPIPSFGAQTVLTLSKFPTNQGYFDLGVVMLAEHHGTHLDASTHYVNNDATLIPGNPPADKRKYLNMLDGKDLTGPIILIDISARVQAELDKNGGKPSPDTGVTDFSNASGNGVTADDIEAVRDKIVDGAWIVVNNGWSRFYFQGTDFAKGPYVNGWNFPGFSPAAVDKIFEIEDAKGVRINGLVADAIGVEGGQSSRGEDDAWTNSWYAHVLGFQRGWKIVENAADLGQLAEVDADDCTLVVGAPKWVRGSGGPARVLALCEE